MSITNVAVSDWYHTPAANCESCDSIIEEIQSLVSRDFEALWVGLVVERATEEPLTVGELARLLNTVRIRYRIVGKRSLQNDYNVCPQCGINLKHTASQSCRTCATKARMPYLCPSCGKMLDRSVVNRNSKATCRGCFLKRVSKPKPPCARCGKPLKDRRTRQCRACFLEDVKTNGQPKRMD